MKKLLLIFYKRYLFNRCFVSDYRKVFATTFYNSEDHKSL